MYDIKIRNGIIVNGTGAPRFKGDLGIRGGRIVAIGDAPDDAVREIDATGKIVCPGFIDVHTHYDAQFFWDRMLSPSPWYGVTTVVMGNCGFALAPTKADDRQGLLECLQHVEGIPFKSSWPAMGNGNWGYETFPEYLDLVERRGSALNMVAQVGHTALRIWVMGAEAASSRVATDEEIAAMCRIAVEGLNAGAGGLSTSSTPAHFGGGGIPVPSRFADEREHLALAGAIMQAKHGVWQGNMGTVINPEFVMRVLDETGVPVTEISPGVFTTNAFDDWKILEELRDLGYQIYGQMGIVPNVLFTGLHEPFMFALDQPGGVFMIPPLTDLFAEFIDMHSNEERLAAYRHPDFLPRFVEETNVESWNATYWPAISIAVSPTQPEWEGRRIVDIAAETGRKPAEILYEISVESDLAARIMIMSEARDMMYLMQQDFVRIGLHDAGAHLAQIAESRWPLSLLGSYVRERGLPLERAVQMATIHCAEAFGILERGLLMAGWHADVVVFDPDSIIDGPIREHPDLPGGATRLMADPFGIDYVIVNGTVIREHGKDSLDPAGPLPGQLIREFAPHSNRRCKPIPAELHARARAQHEKKIQANADRSDGAPPAPDPAQPGRTVVW